MKYLVTAYRSAWIEVEADSVEEAERIGANRIGPPQYWDYFEAEENEDEEN